MVPVLQKVQTEKRAQMCSASDLRLGCGADGERLSLRPMPGQRLPHCQEKEEAGPEDQGDNNEVSFML